MPLIRVKNKTGTWRVEVDSLDMQIEDFQALLESRFNVAQVDQRLYKDQAAAQRKDRMDMALDHSLADFGLKHGSMVFLEFEQEHSGVGDVSVVSLTRMYMHL